MKNFLLLAFLFLSLNLIGQPIRIVDPVYGGPIITEQMMRAINETSADNWGIRETELEKYRGTLTGAGYKICVVDTGAPAHKDLTVTKAANFSTDPSGLDSNGHSTHIGGIIKQVAPKAEVYYAKSLNNKGSGDLSQVTRGVNWCTDYSVDVISLSLGGRSTNAAFKQSIDRANAAGILVYAAAGNDGQHRDGKTNYIGYPGIYSNTLTVGSSNISGNVSSFSSGGPYGTLIAPGENIMSTWLNNCYRQLSGTSMATPFAAGVAVLMKQGGRSYQEIFDETKNYTIDWGAPGYSYDSFYGIISPQKCFDIGNGTEPPKQEPIDPDTPKTLNDLWIKLVGLLILGAGLVLTFLKIRGIKSEPSGGPDSDG